MLDDLQRAVRTVDGEDRTAVPPTIRNIKEPASIAVPAVGR
jgi:hypothetical protein